LRWKEQFPKHAKPSYDDLLAFFHPDIRALFLRFDREMHGRFAVVNKYQRFLSTGWAYGYGRSYGCELLVVTVHDDHFATLGTQVRDEISLQQALNQAQQIYDDGFEARYAAICASHRQKQSARAKLRTAREKLELNQLLVDPETFNRFNWCKKVPRNHLLRLYQSDAKNLLDKDLLEDVGLTFYTRCMQAKDAYAAMNEGKIICHHCRAVLHAGDVSPGGSVFHGPNHPIQCACGYAYTYREYRRSCNAANMPAGRATPIFDHFIQQWPACKHAKAKMMLIDWLIHQFHVSLMSGDAGRSVCRNLIEGTTTQIQALIEQLAYGDGL
jgi:hypothetical protein